METLAVHGGERRPGPEGSVVFPIYQGTVYEVEPGTSYHDLKYIRLNSTPSQHYLHDKLAALEGAEAAVATASGMAAVTTTLLSLLRAGDHLLASDCLYGGTHDFLTHHPGLASHPDHAHAAELLSGFGGMLSLRLRRGEAAAQALLEAVRLPYSAPSLGGVESLITLPAVTSHAGMRCEDRERLGIIDDVIRVSCGF